MKKISLLLALVFIISSCEGDRGPQGPQGPPGFEGRGATIIEIEGDFLSENGYEFGYQIPPDLVEVQESDIIQVYLLEEVIDDVAGPAAVWTPLPASFFLNDGSELIYNYNYTYFDVQFFLGGNANLDIISNDLLLSKEFRIAIIPAAFAENNTSLNSIDAIIEAMPNSEIIKLN